MKLVECANIGETLAKRLGEVGIRNVSALRRVGPANAYRRLSEHAGRPLPVCYYLYSLEGALRGVDWRRLTDAQKARLRAGAGRE